MRIATCMLVALIGLTVCASAQPKVGHWVVGDSFSQHGGILYMDPTQTAPAPLTSIIRAGTQGRVNSLSMHPNNVDFLVGFSSLTRLARVDPNGVIYTLSSIPFSIAGHVKAEDGTVLVISGANIHRVNLATNTSTKFNTSTTPLPPLLKAITIDRATGDVIAGGYNSIVALDGKSGATKRVVTTLVSSPYRIAHDPVSDDFFVTEGPRSAWNRMTRTGQVAWTKLSIGAGGLKMIEQKGLILHSASNYIAVMNDQGSVVGNQVHNFPRTTIYKFDAVEIYGSANLSGVGSTKAGTTYSLNVSFPLAPGGSYQVVGSFSGHTPGFKLPNGDIASLVPDTLFQLMLGSGSIPGVFDHFRGTLNTYGRPAGTSPTIKIPAGLPAGLRLYLQGFVIHPSLPGGIALSNTWAFTTS